jgi:single-stranded-DNA-specific exonuclease
MKYVIQSNTFDIPLIERLLELRGITDHQDQFFDPTFRDYWISGSLLSDFDLGVERIVLAVTRGEKIAIFGDYDVDGVTSTRLLYTFIRNILKHPHVTVRLPNRLEDWYGIKSYHLDEMKKAGVDLVITVDNGITAVKEMLYAREIKLDVVITDHHKQLDEIPQAIAVINPQTSPDYPFKWICGVWVAFKVAVWVMKQLWYSSARMQQVMRYMLPMVAMGTVADCVPLTWENRLFVKKWLEYLNTREWVPQSLLWFIDYINIKWPVDSYHIWYMIWPRINAGGRIMSPYDSLWTLLHHGDKQIKYMENIDNLNTQRRQIQEKMFKMSEEQVNHDHHLLIAGGTDFHEWVVGIVSGRLTERYYKPSLVYKHDIKTGIVVASLRGPAYFSVIEMLYSARELLDRYGWHKQAGWLTVHIDKFDAACKLMHEYCTTQLQDGPPDKESTIDTIIAPHEMNYQTVQQVLRFAPFGQGNPEPLFAWPDVVITAVRKVGQKGNGHLKFTVNYGGVVFDAMRWSKWIRLTDFQVGQIWTMVGKLKSEPQNWYVVIEDIVEMLD